MDNLFNVLHGMGLPEELISELCNCFDWRECGENYGCVEAGLNAFKELKNGKGFGPNNRNRHLINTYPGIPSSDLSDIFIGLSFGSDKLTNLLDAYLEFLSAHISQKTNTPIKCVLFTDKWSSKEFGKYSTLFKNLSNSLKVDSIVFIVTDKTYTILPV